MPSLPQPTAEAADFSLILGAAIAAEIDSAGGWIPFSRYMEMALYLPGLGYYSAGASKFGEAGDFVTAPEISPLFGRTLARQIAEILAATGGEVLEAGAGSGKLAVDVLAELDEIGSLPQRYLILEVSADLRERQRNEIATRLPQLVDRVVWLDRLPERFSGAVIGNEVLDAMPVHVVTWRDDAIYERGVVRAGDGFAWQERPLGPGVLLDVAARIAPGTGYTSEINLAAPAFIRTLAGILEAGAIVLADYGFPAAEYYHPQRRSGTLMCHYRHHAHDDPFFLPGLQDITAHVDFSSVAHAGVDAGLELLGYATQARFLINCGITDLMSRVPPDDVRAYLPLAAGVQKLLGPSEMGELFKVIALGRNVAAPLLGFRSGDRSATL